MCAYVIRRIHKFPFEELLENKPISMARTIEIAFVCVYTRMRGPYTQRILTLERCVKMECLQLSREYFKMIERSNQLNESIIRLWI